MTSKSPSDFLKNIIGKPVIVKLTSSIEYKGILACLDAYMNISLEQAEEWIEGQFKNKYADIFIRGNNVFYVTPQKKRNLQDL
ncbi:u6 snRNA-associated sm-like protein lsm6 [Anaeramoeba ignava]|uniref:U6 snRNA-associated sm-like protein lsm6 n=1 Tax=Anaeramoeba ignava TaxID=1746090 RepID=A0A9Q0LR53_ANAIG|nr:u6 snRNA-associated sm-like protein lsm6 [Anaeramoeba ignava]KAJ5077467.1 u6 snRNA-associated sm-like protein lsm6 [Anaeramoeba ignava]